MKITFDSYGDVNRLQQLCIFARHDQSAITKMADVCSDTADAMTRENASWAVMQRKLASATPGEVVEL